jgi:hypothetical protein
MNRKFLTAFMWVAAMLIVAPMVAEAGWFVPPAGPSAQGASKASVQMGGEFLSRWELQNRDFNDDTESYNQTTTRIRLNTTAKIDEKSSAFIQMQSVRTDGATGNNSSLQANDKDASVGIHQAYLTLKDFYGSTFDLKLGRQEVVMGGHRLLGNTLWTLGAQSHDGLRLNHSHGNSSWSYLYVKAVENGSETDADDTDEDLHIVYGKFKGILGGALELYFIGYVNNRNNTEEDGTSANTVDTVEVDNDFYTVGFRQAGSMAGIKYRGEFYYQWGDADTATASWDRDAYMIGLRAGKGFGGSMSPTLTLWYDLVSGTSQQDANNNQVKSFDTLFDTGHKFYGYMDRFLNMGLTARSTGASVTGDAVGGLGMHDFALKGNIKPSPGWILNGAMHWFWTEQDAYAGIGNGTGTTAANAGDNEIGQELDLDLTHVYNSFTKIVFGYSHFFSGDLSDQLLSSRSDGTGQGDDSDWAYVMLNMKF